MVVLDVREREEFEAEHIAGSICCPLSQFDMLAPGILNNIKDGKVTIMCRTGNRAKMALNELKKFDVGQHEFNVFDGGIVSWRAQGNDVIGKGSTLPIMRQVQIVASSMIMFAFFASKFIAYDFIYLALFVGFGLALAGFAGLCPMVFLLQKMPWNKKKISCLTLKEEHKNSCCG